jgi:WD40 repeat protein
VESVAFSPDGTQVLTGSTIARLWKIDVIDQQLTFSAPAAITVSALAPDGKTILIGDEAGNTGLWDLNTGNLLRNFPKDYHDVKSVAFSPDGKLVAISLGWQPSFDGVDINLYDPATGDLKKTLAIASPHPFINTLAFSSDGKMLLATSEDNVSRLFDVESGQLLRIIKGETQLTLISPDGKLISLNLGSKWWDISSGKEVNFSNEMNGYEMVFSADGSLIAIVNGDNSISVWEFSTKKLINRFSGHTNQITSLAFSPDNKLLLSGSADNTARSWNISTGQQIRVFSGHTAAVTSVGFISDGNKIITTSLDKTVRIWFTDYNVLLDYACTLVGSDLSAGERALYGVSGQDPTCPEFGMQPQPPLSTTTPIPTFTPLPLWTPIATPTQGNLAP